MRASLLLSMAILLACVANSYGAIISGTASFTGGAPLGGSASMVTDGFVPAEGTFWQTSTLYWAGTGLIITVDLGQQYLVQDILVSVDNNDSYQIQYSTNGMAYTNLFAIAIGDGDVGGGMDTFNTLFGDPEYAGATVDFTPVTARFIRIYATGGDTSYSVGELQVSGVLAGVPEPASLAIWGGLGIAGLIVARRRKILAA